VPENCGELPHPVDKIPFFMGKRWTTKKTHPPYMGGVFEISQNIENGRKVPFGGCICG
jgi:hypothetical protein